MRESRGRGRAALAATALVVLACAGCHRRQSAPSVQQAAGKTELGTVSLLFPGADDMLHAETRQLALPVEPDRRVEAVLQALLAGPQTAALVAPLPKGVALNDVYVTPGGVAYVDLGAKDQAAPPPSGSDLELLRVYSLVNSVVDNEPRVRSVVLLWNGAQRTTFAGHVDTTRPLLPDKHWIGK